MDPNATWQEMCEQAEAIVSTGSRDANAERLAELTLFLRDWMTRGGFAPDALRSETDKHREWAVYEARGVLAREEWTSETVEEVNRILAD